MVTALARSRAGDLESLLGALSILEGRLQGLGWLSLWQATRADSAEYVRALTFAIARDTRSELQNPAREAVRLWTLAWLGGDLSACVNMLSGLEYALDLPRGLPDCLLSSVLPLVVRSLKHDEALVRHSAFDFLSAAHAHAQLDRFLHQAAGEELAKSITQQLTFEPEEDEVARELLAGLRADTLPKAAVVAPRALRRLIFDLEDLMSEVSAELGGLDDLASFIRERLLLDAAGDEAKKRHSSLQTVRMLSESPPARLLDSLLRLASVIVRLRSDDETDDDSNSIVRVLAAPAASFPIHIYFNKDYANLVFDVLSDVFAVLNGDLEILNREIFEPSLAQAVLSVVKQAAANGGAVEIVLTDPEASEWQRRLQVDLAQASPESLSVLSSLAKGRGSQGGIRVDRLMVPQANTVRFVFTAIDAMLAKGRIDIDDIEGISSQRQVDYYKQGARVLGLLDEDNELTQRARSLVGLSEHDRLRLAAVYFEDSEIGRAWQAWSAADHIVDIDPDSAGKFLAECVVGLSGSTLPRRASTLRKWHAQLTPYHYTKRQLNLGI
jgi:hypothetical protein